MSLDLLPEERIDLQWYERDKERFAKEIKLIKKKYSNFEIVRLPDARISVVGEIDRWLRICLIFPYLYPLQPPEVKILEILEVPMIKHRLSFINYETNSIEYLSNKRMWNASINAVTVFEWIEEAIEEDRIRMQEAERRRNTRFVI